MSRDLEERKVLVTGAGRGIGAAIALQTADAGALVAVNDLVPERAEQTVSGIVDAGGSAVSIAGDIASRDGSAKVVERAVRALGGLDGLVNNAGVVRFGTLRTSTDEDWDRTIAVDFSAGRLHVQIRIQTAQEGRRRDRKRVLDRCCVSLCHGRVRIRRRRPRWSRSRNNSLWSGDPTGFAVTRLDRA